MGAITANTDRPYSIEDIPDKYRGSAAGRERASAPLISESFAEPVRLTKDAEKGDEVLYAVGRGPAGLVVELHSAYGVATPCALVSFTTHRPDIFDTIDRDALASLHPPTI